MEEENPFKTNAMDEVRMSLYLDVDGVLLETKNTRASKGISRFLSYITATYDCYWLTSHCKGCASTVISYLSLFLSKEDLDKCASIKPTNWNTLKLEGIINPNFIWLDDYPLISEIDMLKRHGEIERLILVDLARIESLEALIPVIEEKRHKLLKREN